MLSSSCYGKETPFTYVPPTVSEEARAFLSGTSNPANNPAYPDKLDLVAWQELKAGAEQFSSERQKVVLKELEPDIRHFKIDNVPVIEVTPKNWRDDGRILIFVHGGGYVFFSAESTLDSAALMATATQMKVISIDYQTAPQGNWKTATDEVNRVLNALHRAGQKMENTAIYGDSAGGGLVSGSILKLRDSGHPVPAAAVLWSPWSDVTSNGDTYKTLAHAEPTYVYEAHLYPSVLAYAEEKYHKHPYVSPVYADYSLGFSPTLIQGGTKEIFLSNFVRHYQALDVAGIPVKLDLYEGMPHVFQVQIPHAPETRLALQKAADFIDKYVEQAQ